MTLDEAIKHAEEVAEENENNAQMWHKQTKGRLVDFCDKAIQAENNCVKCAEEHRQLAEWLKELKQLRGQTWWIPVSERLPKDGQKVLVTTRSDNILDVAIDTSIFYHASAFWKHYVIAWMPLPKPYVPQERSEQV